MDDGDFFGGDGVVRDKVVVGVVAVGDDVARPAERTAKKPRERFAGAHRCDDGGVWKIFLNAAGVAVGHPAHAKNDIGCGGGECGDEPGCEPVETKIER